MGALRVGGSSVEHQEQRTHAGCWGPAGRLRRGTGQRAVALGGAWERLEEGVLACEALGSVQGAFPQSGPVCKQSFPFPCSHKGQSTTVGTGWEVRGGTVTGPEPETSRRSRCPTPAARRSAPAPGVGRDFAGREPHALAVGPSPGKANRFPLLTVLLQF